MRLWLRYVREKKGVILLYLITAALFVVVGSLYHIENLDKLLYGALMTFALWVMAGLTGGMCYVRKCRQLEEAFRQFGQYGDLNLPDWNPRGEDRIEHAETLDEAQGILLSSVYESRVKEKGIWDKKTAEYKEYYVMWTHQIKTPISAMKLLLEDGGIGGREAFLMREELFKIEQYVEMVLTYQRLESMAADLVLQEYDLYTLVKQAVKKYSVLFINKGLKLELQEMQVKILTDEKWFIFCLEQLLSNSIKYTKEGGITISAAQDEDRARLCIEDTGIGIRREDLPRIFEKGFTGYNGRMDKRSTGIGLYLCREILQNLGIRIKVESQEGEGTRVTLGWNQADPFLQAD